jgi:carbamoyl-phosphate synthase large subunit
VTLADPRNGEAATLLVTAKRAGFGDRELATMAGIREADLRAARGALGLRPGYAMVDTCAAEFAAETPYFYSTYAAAGSEPEAPPVPRPAALVIGSGPVRIGQGIEFDYCAVHAADTLRRAGWQAVMINSNPETVSTDFDASSRLYFEPLDPESVRSVIEAETPDGMEPLPAMVAYGGQTPLNLAAPLAAQGVPLLGSDLETIDQAEERTRFAALLDRLGIPQPEGGMAHSIEEALTLAERIGYPVIVRPSFVIGGLAIDFCYSPDDLVASSRRRRWSTPTGPSGSTATWRGSRSTSTRSATASGPDPGSPRARRASRRPQRRQRRVFPPQTVAAADQGLIVETMERIVLALGAAASATPSSSSARTAST